MRENRPYGSEGGESGSTGLPYPYPNSRISTGDLLPNSRISTGDLLPIRVGLSLLARRTPKGLPQDLRTQPSVSERMSRPQIDQGDHRWGK